MSHKHHFLVSTTLVFSFLYTQNTEKNIVVSPFLSKIKKAGENKTKDHLKRKNFKEQCFYCWGLGWTLLKYPPLCFKEEIFSLSWEEAVLE